ncbi:hypothetical protein NRB20_45510 [Nocardia sp. RB20]|uniref:Tat pathway signal sequence domain protein n=1 Tax=Nocardia macrotermitis TaxID=2585198 RepID=A0A7K0D6R2_9NOCA|nr:hypothetical protein [Nocardia macrotermitis]
MAAAIVAVSSTLFAPCVTASAGTPQCTPTTPNGPLWVTANCVDPTYGKPVIDSQADITYPVVAHKVTGHFNGTDKRFTIELPPKDMWQGRFFQLVYPLLDETIDDRNLEFYVASGGYGVQTNGGSGYRVDAAAAKFAKTVAARYYGTNQRIYGYLFGGSGGSYETIGADENTIGVWDGAVPYIPGVPTSIPNNFFIRALGSIVLRNKASQIADAVAPGGSGDPAAGLNAMQRAVLSELTRSGVPLRALEDYQYVFGLNGNTTPAGPDELLGFASAVRAADATYADDFWSKPGYLGAEKSALGDFLRAGKVDRTVRITAVNRDPQGNPTSLVLDGIPANPYGTGLDFTLFAADGANRGSLSGSLDTATKIFTLAGGNSGGALAAIAAGAELRIDNRWYLALPAYQRYQVPTRPGFYSFDQYRGLAGIPRYPRRPAQVDIGIAAGVTGGGTYSGSIHAKTIVVGNLLDSDAFAWDGDWYSQQVKQALGNAYHDNFRLWYNDNADHIAPGRTDRLIDYTGILHQALRDVAAWAEKGIPPAESTRYRQQDSQITVPATAAERRGIQPVVDLTADGKNRVEVHTGTAVTFKARIQVPPGQGKIVDIAWNYTGTGAFKTIQLTGSPRESIDVTKTFTFDKPGTYFPALLATAQRGGDANARYTRVQNLGRMRVVVH